VFLRDSWEELKARQPGMMLLISMGLLVAFGVNQAIERTVTVLVIASPTPSAWPSRLPLPSPRTWPPGTGSW
jgi:hypothetical protein